MHGIGVLLVILLASSIPAIAVFGWFRIARYPVSTAQFSAFLLAGAASFFPALVFQRLLATGNGLMLADKQGLLKEIFIRIAFTEELSRLLVLAVLFLVIRRLKPSMPEEKTVVTMAVAGLVAGLGFAVLESAVYGASVPVNALFRAFTSAPLHGACGTRVGIALGMFRQSPVLSVFRFLAAVVIHGVYNFMLLIPGTFPLIGATLLALSALASSILAIRGGMRETAQE